MLYMATNRRGKKVKIPGYGAWADMLQRCNNPKLKNYSLYGGRGIGVCERWRSFDNFHEDMGDKPTGLTLDRIDSNGNYCPENCRWATCREQSLNTRRNHYLDYNGMRMTVTEWAIEKGIKPVTLFSRLFAYGWSVDNALTKPVKDVGWRAEQ